MCGFDVEAFQSSGGFLVHYSLCIFTDRKLMLFPFGIYTVFPVLPYMSFMHTCNIDS